MTVVAVAAVAATAGVVVARRRPAPRPAESTHPAAPEANATEQTTAVREVETDAPRPRPHWAVMIPVAGVVAAAVSIGVWANRTDPDVPGDGRPVVTADGVPTATLVAGTGSNLSSGIGLGTTPTSPWDRINTGPMAGPSGSTIPPASAVHVGDGGEQGADVTIGYYGDSDSSLLPGNARTDGKRVLWLRVNIRNTGDQPFFGRMDRTSWLEDSLGGRYRLDEALTRATGWVYSQVSPGAEGERMVLFVVDRDADLTSLHFHLDPGGADLSGDLPFSV